MTFMSSDIPEQSLKITVHLSVFQIIQRVDKVCVLF